MSENREQLRQAYQRTEATAASFIPAKPKVDIYGKAHAQGSRMPGIPNIYRRQMV